MKKLYILQKVERSWHICDAPDFEKGEIITAEWYGAEEVGTYFDKETAMRALQESKAVWELDEETRHVNVTQYYLEEWGYNAATDELTDFNDIIAAKKFCFKLIDDTNRDVTAEFGADKFYKYSEFVKKAAETNMKIKVEWYTEVE